MSTQPAKKAPPPLPPRRRDPLTESGIEWRESSLLEDDADATIPVPLVPKKTPPPLRRSRPLPPPSASWRPGPALVAMRPPARGPLPQVVAPPRPQTLPLPSPVPPPPHVHATALPSRPLARVVPLPLPPRPVAALPPPAALPRTLPPPVSGTHARTLPPPVSGTHARTLPPPVSGAHARTLPPSIVPPAPVPVPPPSSRRRSAVTPVSVALPPPSRPPIAAAPAPMPLPPPSRPPQSAVAQEVPSVIFSAQAPSRRGWARAAAESEQFQVLAPSEMRSDHDRFSQTRVGFRQLATAVRPWLTRRNSILGGALLAAILALVVLIRPDTGRLRVNVGPYHGPRIDRAEVFVDGRKHCEVVPCVIEDLPAGPKMIRVVAANIVTPDVILGTVEAGTESTVIVPAFAIKGRDMRAAR